MRAPVFDVGVRGLLRSSGAALPRSSGARRINAVLSEAAMAAEALCTRGARRPYTLDARRLLRRISTMPRLSEYFLPTEKQPPSDAEAVSHKLMVRAGLIRQMG